MLVMLLSLLSTIFLRTALSEDVIIQRHFKGDIFTRECSSTSNFGCPERTASAGQVSPGLGPGRVCSCQCPPEAPTYREDVGSCVSTIAECPVANFVTGTLTETIPFVFLPLPGHLVYPSGHVSIPQSVCVVSRVDMMTDNGWTNINNITSLSLEFQQPFQLYREEEKTYLQWMGREILHQSLEGRLALVNLLCKEGAGGSRKIFSPCVSFRIAGSPGKSVLVEEYSSSESLTQRDYITIGLCAGFLVLLYMFGMIVLIVVKKKQRRDARMREQFLNMPLPTGLGYKSSRILGLENKIEKGKLGALNDDVRYSIKTKSFSQIEPRISREIKNIPSQDKVEEKIYDITKNGHSGSESEHSDQSSGSVLELNEKLLEAHKKVVQLKLNKEVAKNFHGAEKKILKDRENTGDSESIEDLVNKKQHTIVGKRSSNKFSPKLNEIKEENRRLERMTRDIPPSLDSGIVTRSGSSHSNDNQQETDTDITDTEDSDQNRLDATTDDDEDFLSKNDLKMFGKNSPKKMTTMDVSMDESDILSDIYSIAASKVPKVLPSDTDSIYSLTSTIDKDFDYDSLDQKMMGNVRHIYRNPNIVKKSSNVPAKTKVEKEDSYEEINMNIKNIKSVPETKHVPGLYINNDYDTNTNENSEIEDNEENEENEDKENENKDDQLIYSSEEKMMISITGNSESVFSNKLRIEVNAKNEKVEGAKQSNSQHKVWTNFAGSNLTNFADCPVSSRVPVMNDKESEGERRAESSRLSLGPQRPITGPPSLPPKTRGTPRLPPKPLESNLNSTVTRQRSKRPLPPLPAPRVPPPPPPLPK